MNLGPLIFLAAFFALSASWFGLILKPTFQLGHLQQTNTVGLGAAYPLARSGLAQQGLQIYRANGCVSCHSQQVVQEGYVCEVLLAEAGTNLALLFAELKQVNAEISDAEAQTIVTQLPKTVLRTNAKADADTAAKRLSATGAKAQVLVRPIGPDIARGWGQRRSVAEDYLYDSPVLPGSMRVGPDLANIGARSPDFNWHLRHLYAPGSEVKGSIMPPYRFLFETRKIGRQASPEALKLADGVVPAGYEVIPKTEARALAAYMISLRTDVPLFSTPMPNVAAPATPAGTNAPAAAPGGGANTNAPAQ